MGRTPQKSLPQAPWNEVFFSSKAASVCRQMWDGGLTRGIKWLFKTSFLPCIQISKWHSWAGGHLGFQVCDVFLHWGLAEIRERKKVS